ncbi:hypothetical protein K7472_16160 [Streptomyces sp. PTM05]|uniref:Uncharacterized protein n=1 Tax=Streptantibioticus parmotrematis TaxID=2873249 RepID=A0ABS7QT67_9ACTN|nr:hypothetical protein [Streptantibioticus parmotrematis]MBY8886389.1 hypothetical protein [Streptantibioticus parmotrematis]
MNAKSAGTTIGYDDLVIEELVSDLATTEAQGCTILCQSSLVEADRRIAA